MLNLTRFSFTKTHKSDARMVRSASGGQSPCCCSCGTCLLYIQRSSLNAPEPQVGRWTHKLQTPLNISAPVERPESRRNDDQHHHQGHDQHNLRRLPDRFDSYCTRQCGDALPPSETQSIVVKHRNSRMNF